MRVNPKTERGVVLLTATVLALELTPDFTSFSGVVSACILSSIITIMLVVILEGFKFGGPRF